MKGPVAKISGDTKNRVEKSISHGTLQKFQHVVQSFQERSRHIGSPNGQRLISSGTVSDRRLVSHQVPICIMLNHVTSRVPPVVKDLGTENMPSHTPHRLVSLPCEPIVPQLLGIEVVNFKGAVVNMRSLVRAHEEGMVVNGVASLVDVGKHCDVDFLAVFFHVEEIARDEVEIPGIEVKHGREVLYAVSEVAKLLLSDNESCFWRLLDYTLCTGAGPTLNRWNFRRRGLSAS